jgi:hypothetical protein
MQLHAGTGGVRDDAILVEVDTQLDIFQRIAADPINGRFERPTGIEQVLADIDARGLRRTISQPIEIKIFGEAYSPELEARIGEAVRRYCAVKVEFAREKLRGTVRAGREALWLGLIFLGVCLLLSSVITATQLLPSFFKQLFGEGLNIAGWVGLWRPIELLLYETWPIRHEIRVLESMETRKIVLDPNSGKG